jgi:gamma-glutamyltranspeptidase/glutathione hydrolase
MATAPAQSVQQAAGDARRAGVVAAHSLAARAGADILEAGGNAADAAVAVAAALAVVDPANCGIGGYGGLAVVLRADEEGASQVSFNAVVPRGYPAEGDSSGAGAQVSPPAVVPGLCALQSRFGRLPPDAPWAPAIRLAREGFPVGRDLAATLRWASTRHRTLSDEFRRIFFPGGAPAQEGQVLRQPEMAQTLELIAKRGAQAVGAGPVAEAVCRTVREAGGCVAPEDLASIAVKVAAAAEQRYGDAHVWAPDPEECGSSILFAALRDLDGRALGEARGGQYVDALRHAIADAWRMRNARYRPRVRAAAQTTHMCAGDADGMLVSMTFTHGPTWFGSGLVAPGTGMVLNTGTAIFARRASDGALVAQPHLTPVVMRRAGATFALGTPGGTRIPSIVLQAILDLVHYGVAPEEVFQGVRVSADGEGALEGEAALAARLPGTPFREIRTAEYFGPAGGLARPAGKKEWVAMLDPRFQGACAFAS